MPTITRFEDIRSWQTARDLTRRVYRVTSQGGFARDFGLTDQIRRAAVSVMSNIAEGFESDTQAQFINYLGHAKASAGEVRAQLYVALDVGYITEERFQPLLDLAEKTSRQLSAFISYLKNHPDRHPIREPAAEYVARAPTSGPSLAALEERLRPIFERWHVLRAVVFGSVARDEQSNHSDLDLLIVQRTTKRWLDRYDGILREVVQAVPGRDVDVLIYTPDELERLADRPFVSRALREGKTIYESDEEQEPG